MRTCKKCGKKLGNTNKKGLCLACNPDYRFLRRKCECGCGNYCRNKYYRGHHQIGKKNHQWKNGMKKHKDGYVYVRLYPENPYFSMADKNTYCLEHRYKMARKLGRCLTTDEVVHHKDRKDDNRLYKLILHKKSEHDSFLKTFNDNKDNNLKNIIMKAFKEGKTKQELAEHFKVNWRTIHNWCKRFTITI